MCSQYSPGVAWVLMHGRCRVYRSLRSTIEVVWCDRRTATAPTGIIWRDFRGWYATLHPDFCAKDAHRERRSFGGAP